MPTDQSDRGTPSIEVPSSQACQVDEQDYPSQTLKSLRVLQHGARELNSYKYALSFKKREEEH